MMRYIVMFMAITACGWSVLVLSWALPLWSVERSPFESAYTQGHEFTFYPVMASHLTIGARKYSLRVEPADHVGSNLRVRVDPLAQGTLITADSPFLLCLGWCEPASAEIVVQNEKDAADWRRWIEAEAAKLYANKDATVDPARVMPPS